MRRLIECIKERTILSAPGYRTKSGPNGTTLEIGPGKHRSSPASVLPWSFSCTEDPDTRERTGGWTNGRIQVGYETRWATPDLQNDEVFQVKDTDTCDDGFHSIEVDLNEMTVKVIVYEGAYKPSEFEKGMVRIPLGVVSEGKLVSGVHVNPVCYHYL